MNENQEIKGKLRFISTHVSRQEFWSNESVEMVSQKSQISQANNDRQCTSWQTVEYPVKLKVNLMCKVFYISLYDISISVEDYGAQANPSRIKLNIMNCHTTKATTGLWVMGFGYLLIQTRTQIKRSCTCRRSAHLLFVASHTRAICGDRDIEREREGGREMWNLGRKNRLELSKWNVRITI